MAHLLEYVGCVHIYLGPYRGNPIALYLKRARSSCQISPKVYPWNGVVGTGETPNKAAADFEEKWKSQGLSADMYSGPFVGRRNQTRKTSSTQTSCCCKAGAPAIAGLLPAASMHLRF